MPRPAMDEPSVLEAVLAGYEAEGFDVFVHPSTAVLPAFMKGYSPDAIAMRPDRKIAIEVKSSERQAPDQISRLQELFSHHPEWEFQVFYAPPRSPAVTIGIPTPLAIDTAISQVRELQESDRLSAALIVGWSLLEAVARSLLPNQLG